ncbi:TRAP transporter substrate-binding protein [Oceanobacter mangrovi]|uniref:TRAP transporter substrate-binding protein n=1 Tax=Oceanobacter mangrovi TaxID=2862510 RepID=UPI001FE77AC4|nr:TRAP transporter substrate-binding protein [Oceanobacter mangrovi]
MKIKTLMESLPLRASALAKALAMTVSIGAASAALAAEPEYTFKLHHMSPLTSNAHMNFLEPWAEKVMKESNGRIKIDIYPSMQLGGKPPQLYDQARKGVADIVWTVGGYTPGRFPKAGAFELPFMATSGKVSSQALQEYAEQEMQQEFSDVHLLALHTHYAGSILVRDRAINSMKDMEGLKVRAPNKLMAEALVRVGASPVFLPVPSLPSAISKGVVDSALLAYEVVTPLKIHEMVKYATEIHGKRGLYTQFFIFAMNKDSYDKLPADLQKVIDNNSGIETAGWIGQVWDTAEVRNRQTVVDNGNKINVLSPAETERWKQAMQPVTDDWIAEMDKEGYDGKALYKKANDLIEKYEAL